VIYFNLFLYELAKHCEYSIFF